MITVNREASSNIWRFFGHKIGIFQETEQKRVAALAEGENPRTNPDTAFPPALQSIGSRRGRSVGRSVGRSSAIPRGSRRRNLAPKMDWTWSNFFRDTVDIGYKVNVRAIYVSDKALIKLFKFGWEVPGLISDIMALRPMTLYPTSTAHTTRRNTRSGRQAGPQDMQSDISRFLRSRRYHSSVALLSLNLWFTLDTIMGNYYTPVRAMREIMPPHDT